MASHRTAAQIALVGGDSLLGRELREVFTGSMRGLKLKLVGSEDPETAVLTELGGEAVVMTGLDAATVREAQLLLLAGSAESTRKAMELVQAAPRPPAVVDLSCALEDDPGVRLRAPAAEPAGYRSAPAAIQLLAHPAAIVLAAFLRKLHETCAVRTSVVQIFEPASERGRAGVDELQQQTVQLLSFKKPVQRIFDAQLSFNLLARYGPEAPVNLESVEQRIEKHLATLLSLDPPAPMPSIRLLQVPVMHGHSFSVWTEFEAPPEIEQMRKAFTAPAFDWWGADLDAPAPVGIAGQSGVTIGRAERDRNHPRAAWFWLVADNFRVSADNAVELARSMLTGREER